MYVIDGFQRFVGSKTTWWFRNSGYDIPLKDVNQFKQVIVQRVDFPNKWTDQSVYAWFESVDEKTIQEIRSFVDAPQLNISTGLQALGFLTRRYGHVFIHGFDSFDPPHLYFEQSGELRHSLDEHKYIDHLKSIGLATELSELMRSK